MVGWAWYSCKPLRAGTRAGSTARSLCRTSARQVQRPEPFRSILGHSLRCSATLAWCKLLREWLFWRCGPRLVWWGRSLCTAGFVLSLQYLGWLFTKALAHCGRETDSVKGRFGHLPARALQWNCCLFVVWHPRYAARFLLARRSGRAGHVRLRVLHWRAHRTCHRCPIYATAAAATGCLQLAAL